MNGTKKFISCVLILLSTISLQAQFDFPDLNEEDMAALQTDVAAIDEFIKSLPPEEQRKIEEEALKILSEMPEEDLEKFMQLSEQIATGLEEEYWPEPEQPASAQEPEPEKRIDERQQARINREKAALRDLINTIIKKLDAIETKTATMHRISDRPQLEQQWRNQRAAVDETRALLAHFIHPVAADSDQLIGKLIADKYRAYRTQLENLKHLIVRIEPRITIPDSHGLRKASPHALRALNQLITDIQGLSLPSLITQTKEIMEKIAPKELKKAQEERARTSSPSSDRSDRSGRHDYYPDSPGYYGPPARRTTDAGRYVQQTPDEQIPSKGPSTPAGSKQTPAKKAKSIPKRAIQRLIVPGAYGQKFGERLEEFNNDLMTVAQTLKKQPLLRNLESYMQSNEPANATVDFALDTITFACTAATKKMKRINQEIGRLSPKEQKKVRDTLKDIALKDLKLGTWTKSLQNVKPDKVPAGKKQQLKSIGTTIKSCKLLLDALDGKKAPPKTNGSPKS